MEFRRILMEDYGWPDNFRREDWKRDHQDIFGRFVDETIPNNGRAAPPEKHYDFVDDETLMNYPHWLPRSANRATSGNIMYWKLD